jgi:hypothetical protein
VSRQTKVGLAVAAVSIALGVAADALFQGQAFGLNVVLWVAAFVAALAGLISFTGAPLHQGRRFLAVPAVVLAAQFAWHDSDLLTAVNFLALAVIVAATGLRRGFRGLRRAGVTDYVGGFVASAAATAAGPVPLLDNDIQWSELRSGEAAPRLLAAGKGLALAAPLLVVFGALFATADAVFKGLLNDAVPSPGAALVRIAASAGGAWVVVGLLRDLLTARESGRIVSAAALTRKRPRVSLGATEVAIALGLLDLLFLGFVIVQLRYLFGGRGLVEARTHLTYASYARHGFFELVVASALALPVLLLGDWTRRREGRVYERIFRAEAGVLILLLLVVMASALQRMRLYEHEYGLTELRVYASGVILWLAAVFVWLALTTLRGRPHAFVPGALALGLAATLALNVLNPDSLIARTNVGRPKVDVAYLGSLSDDAVPTLVDRVEKLPPAKAKRLAADLLGRGFTGGDWRGWNLSRSRARRAVTANYTKLARLARG